MITQGTTVGERVAVQFSLGSAAGETLRMGNKLQKQKHLALQPKIKTD